MARDPADNDLFSATSKYSTKSFKDAGWLGQQEITRRISTSPLTLSKARKLVSNRVIIVLTGPGLTSESFFRSTKDQRQSQQAQRPVPRETSAPFLMISYRLNISRELTDAEQISELAHDLARHAETPESRAELQAWLQHGADNWIRERRPALAAVIEAGALLALPETVPVVLSVLRDDDAEPLVASVAAQRVRLLTIEDPAVEAEIGALLARRIDAWLREPVRRQHAIFALPSASRFLWRADRAWLESRIRDGDTEIVWAICQGLLDVAGAVTLRMDALAAESLHRTIVARLESELAQPEPPFDPSRPDVAASMIWTLGALCTETTITETAALLVRTFLGARGFQDSASVRSGRLLVQRWTARGVKALLDAFGAPPPASCARYLALLSVGR